MNRIEKYFKGNEKALISYITAGDPTLDKTEKMILEMEKNGANIIEIGIPFSDPLADGPVIQRAASRALKNGTKVAGIFKMVKRLREKTKVPLVFLVYYNSIFNYGVDKFIKKCQEVGIDGLIVPDLPLEEREELVENLDQSKTAFIPLVSPNSGERIADIVKDSRGFIYCVSSYGVTGVRDSFQVNLKSFIEKVRKETNLPLAIGFGISNNKKVKEVQKLVESAIVGSAIVKEVEKTNGDSLKVGELVRSLARA